MLMDCLFSVVAVYLTEQLEGLEQKLSTQLAKLFEARRRRAFLLGFAEAPVTFINGVIASQVWLLLSTADSNSWCVIPACALNKFFDGDRALMMTQACVTLFGGHRALCAVGQKGVGSGVLLLQHLSCLFLALPSASSCAWLCLLRLLSGRLVNFVQHAQDQSMLSLSGARMCFLKNGWRRLPQNIWPNAMGILACNK